MSCPHPRYIHVNRTEQYDLLPPPSPQELDPVTLHNQALMNIEESPTQGFEKLQFLLQQVSCPPETFSNLLLLYIKHEVSTAWWQFLQVAFHLRGTIAMKYVALLKPGSNLPQFNRYWDFPPAFMHCIN